MAHNEDNCITDMLEGNAEVAADADHTDEFSGKQQDHSQDSNAMELGTTGHTLQ